MSEMRKSNKDKSCKSKKKHPSGESSIKEPFFSLYREALMELFFPLNVYCHICKGPLPKTAPTSAAAYQAYLCPFCIDEIPWIEEPYCKKCSIPLFEHLTEHTPYPEEILRPLPSPKDLCPECRADSPLDRNLSVCLYEKPLKKAIYAFKYSDKTYLARIFALMMAEKLRSLPREDQAFDRILSVPLHKKRLRRRGYNQADLLAKYLSTELKIPYDPGALIRIKETRTMNQLSKSQRSPNVRDAFSLSKSFPKTEKILLIDDIYTTGATAKAIAACLKSHGTGHITMLSIARVML